MIEVNALQTKEITVGLDDWTVKKLMIEQLLELFDLRDGAYVKDGVLIFNEWKSDGPHGWTNTRRLRTATEEDIAAILVIKKISEEL